MFDSQEFSLLHKVDSWEKVDELGSAFFPKLTALKNKATDLILDIYGIDTDEIYKTYQYPTPSQTRRKGTEFNPERNSSGVGVSFRAKGKPTDLYRPNGNLCKMHFAHLGFDIQYFENTFKLSTGSINYALSICFQPYILRYDKNHLIDLSEAVAAHRVDEIICSDICAENVLGDFLMSHNTISLVDLLQTDKMWILLNIVDLSNITNETMASLVITCAAFFPVLDIFTRQSNGEKLFKCRRNTLIPLGDLKYREKFLEWYFSSASDYIKNFNVEPITQNNYWQSESLTRSIFENLLNCSFVKKRPSWLRTSSNQRSMELDGFNEDLKLAFEYQGEYHYSYIFPDQEPPEKIQKKDAKKFKICKKNGVDLIQVPYKQKGNRNYIISRLQELGREDINALLR